MGEGKTRGHFLFGINQWADQTAGFPTFQAPNSIVQGRCMYILYVYPGFNIYIYKYSIIHLDIYIYIWAHISHVPPSLDTHTPTCPPDHPYPRRRPLCHSPLTPQTTPSAEPPQTAAAPFLPCQCSPPALAYRRNPLPAAAPFQPQLPLQRPPAFSPPPAASPTCRVPPP